MRTLKIFLFVLFILPTLPAQSQDYDDSPRRSVDQEAESQTERLRQELDLTSGQARRVYQINLRYARERQVSNKRSEAMERMRNKNADLQRVLNEDQYNRLQNKRYERSTFELPAGDRNRPVNSSGYRPSSGSRTYRSTRSGTNVRNYDRSSDTNSQSRKSTPAIRRTNSRSTYRSRSVVPSDTRRRETRDNTYRR